MFPKGNQHWVVTLPASLNGDCMSCWSDDNCAFGGRKPAHIDRGQIQLQEQDDHDANMKMISVCGGNEKTGKRFFSVIHIRHDNSLSLPPDGTQPALACYAHSRSGDPNLKICTFEPNAQSVDGSYSPMGDIFVYGQKV